MAAPDTGAQDRARSAWADLDAAARALRRPDLAPSRSVDRALRTAPPAPRATPARPRRHRRRWPWIVPVAAAVVLGVLAMTGTFRSRATSPVDLTPLQTSSVAALAGAPTGDVATDRAIVGNRALLVVEVGDDLTSSQWDDLADAMAADYPDSVAFVIGGGSIEAGALGASAGKGDYDDDSLLDDYYDIQLPAVGSEALVRQIALLYDRIGAAGSIHPALRSTYDPPRRPWVPIAIVLVMALAAAALLVRLGARRIVAAVDAGQEAQGERNALRLRLAALAPGLLGDTGSGRFEQVQQLLADLTTAPDDELPALATRVETLVGGATPENGLAADR